MDTFCWQDDVVWAAGAWLFIYCDSGVFVSIKDFRKQFPQVITLNGEVSFQFKPKYGMGCRNEKKSFILCVYNTHQDKFYAIGDHLGLVGVSREELDLSFNSPLPFSIHRLLQDLIVFSPQIFLCRSLPFLCFVFCHLTKRGL